MTTTAPALPALTRHTDGTTTHYTFTHQGTPCEVRKDHTGWHVTGPADTGLLGTDKKTRKAAITNALLVLDTPAPEDDTPQQYPAGSRITCTDHRTRTLTTAAFPPGRPAQLTMTNGSVWPADKCTLVNTDRIPLALLSLDWATRIIRTTPDPDSAEYRTAVQGIGTAMAYLAKAAPFMTETLRATWGRITVEIPLTEVAPTDYLHHDTGARVGVIDCGTTVNEAGWNAWWADVLGVTPEDRAATWTKPWAMGRTIDVEAPGWNTATVDRVLPKPLTIPERTVLEAEAGAFVGADAMNVLLGQACPACDTEPDEMCAGCGRCACDRHDTCTRPATA